MSTSLRALGAALRPRAAHGLPKVAIAWLVVSCTPAAPPAPRASAPSTQAPAPPPADASAPSSLLELRVGTSGDYAPFSVRSPGGEPRGFDPELAEAMAQDLGVRLRWVTFRWPELSREIGEGDFDVAMGGVTWQPERAVVGYMTREVARGGPCVLGDAAARRVAVNRGGILEGWARSHLADRELVVVSDNGSLPGLLAEAQVGAIVTDSFEQHAFRRPGWALRCEPPLLRKAYWVAPARAADLGPRIDAWLAAHRDRVKDAQERWFGERQRLDELSDLVDQLARRMAFMPLVGDLKAKRGLPIEDTAREHVVIELAVASAHARGLPEAAVRDLFALQIELSKAVERRMHESSTLDLSTQIRPALNEVGARIVDALQAAHDAHRLAGFALSDLDPLAPWLDEGERGQLLARLRAIE